MRETKSARDLEHWALTASPVRQTDGRRDLAWLALQTEDGRPDDPRGELDRRALVYRRSTPPGPAPAPASARPELRRDTAGAPRRWERSGWAFEFPSREF